MDTGSGAFCAYQLMVRYCSVRVDIICVAVERSRKETEMPSEFQSRYHHVEEGQLSSEKWQNWQDWILWLGTSEKPRKQQTNS